MIDLRKKYVGWNNKPRKGTKDKNRMTNNNNRFERFTKTSPRQSRRLV
jgi:hypothetical protein